MIRMEYINCLWESPEWEFIDNFETEEDMWENIKDFLKKCGFNFLLPRKMFMEDGWIMIDFGSYDQFYRYKETK